MTNKYSNLSDFDINELIVSSLIGSYKDGYMWTGNRYINHQKLPNDKLDNSVAISYEFICRPVTCEFDACNNYKYAFQLMISNDISLVKHNNVYDAVYKYGEHSKPIRSVNKNPCRAIAECFLLMKDCKNDI